VNTEPLPGSLATVMSPPIIWQNFRLITKPSPVPPYLLAVVEEAWENSWKAKSPSVLGAPSQALVWRYLGDIMPSDQSIHL
jgi:hypothetical protein